MPERKPNLFIVGLPRSGTSSLHRYLSAHPEVLMSEVKEPHHFSADLTEESDRRLGRKVLLPFRELPQYLWLFRNATDEKYLGEASVLYLYSKVAAERIFAFNPEARIIAMLREPVGFLHSLHSRLVFHGDDDCPSFVRALELEPERKQGRHLPRGVRFPSLLYYSDLARFSEQLERYRERFPPEQIKVILFDDFKADTEAVYRDVLRFLGVEDQPIRPAVFASRNAHRMPRSLALAGFLTGPVFHAAPLYKRKDFPRIPGLPAPLLGRILPAGANRALFRVLNRLNTRRVPRPELDAETRRRLMARFRPEVERLGALLGRDLIGLWGYDTVQESAGAGR